jgi:hypothetical protein
LANAPQQTKEPSWDLPPVEESHQAFGDEHRIDGMVNNPPSDLPTSAESMDDHFSPTIVIDWVDQPQVHQENDPASDSDVKEDAAFSFMPRRTQRKRADRYLSQKLMLSLSVVLALLLTSQFLYLERDRIGANNPALRPLLAYGCELLGCAISAPRQIESIAIDSSAFTHVKTGVYNLSLSLRNSAAIDLAAPALELTLTDMQDQALVRRVLMPGEYSVKTLLGSRAELVANIPIVLRAGVAYEKISGYKLLAFYP